MASRPFALIGVNSDKTKKRVFEAMERENITWRSFWNGGGTKGPISTQYGVKGWPTIYVLDHEGVIRAKGVRGEAMDKVVDELVAAAEAAGMTASPPPGQGPREFVDATGKYKRMATFVKFEGGRAYLELEDGTVVDMSMNDLSDADQEYIRNELKKRRRK